jgi:hypothetical protein
MSVSVLKKTVHCLDCAATVIGKEFLPSTGQNTSPQTKIFAAKELQGGQVYETENSGHECQ